MSKHTYTDSYGNVYPWEGPVGRYYERGNNTSRMPQIRNEVSVYYFDLGIKEEREEYGRHLTAIANNQVVPVCDRHFESDGMLKAVLIVKHSYACDPDYVKEGASEKGIPINIVNEFQGEEALVSPPSIEPGGIQVDTSKNFISMGSLIPSSSSFRSIDENEG